MNLLYLCMYIIVVCLYFMRSVCTEGEFPVPELVVANSLMMKGAQRKGH